MAMLKNNKVDAIDQAGEAGSELRTTKNEHDISRENISPRKSLDTASSFGSGITAGYFGAADDSTGLDNAESAAEQREIVDLVKHALKDKNRNILMAKMFVTLSIPLIALIVLSTITLVQTFRNQQLMKQTSVSIQNFFLIDALVTSLQVERGTSATYISSSGKNRQALATLYHKYNETDHRVKNLKNWPSNFQYDGRIAPSIGTFKNILLYLRQQVLSLDLTFDESVRKYTEINAQLIEITTSDLNIVGELSSLMVGASAMLQASDDMGIQRALGASYFTLCYFPDDIYRWFAQLDGQINTKRGTAFIYYTPAQSSWKKLLSPDVDNVIQEQKDLVYSRDYVSFCNLLPEEDKFKNSAKFFENMTSYILAWKNLRTELVEAIEAAVDSESRAGNGNVILYTLLILFIFIAFIVAVILATKYGKNITQLTSKIAKFAKQMTIKSVALNKEKKRTEFLLYQMLPRAVADQLRAKKEVLPQYHDSVTIFFSDIVGFTDICSRSSPMDVVNMLNNVYSAFDNTIDLYDVYKVETIGDAYMVASGVPTANQSHAKEICLMALGIQKALSRVVIPHIPDESLVLRIGIHSGTCVAGVVGIKMPRYCLFGDTVNTASRMESTGQGNKIHISQAVRDALGQFPGFQIVERGHIDVKGKGQMITYWLEGYAWQEENHMTVSFRD